MGCIFLKLKLKTKEFLAAPGVKIDFMVGYFSSSTDFCVLLATFLIPCFIYFRLRDSDDFLASLLLSR